MISLLDIIQFISINSSIWYARYTNLFNFVFIPKQTVKDASLGGLLFIDFPPDYIVDSYNGNCSINQAFSFVANCYQINNRFFVNATNTAWKYGSNPPLNLSIVNVRNPDYNSSTRTFIIGNYDTITQSILGRTYSTLNPAYLTYEYDGYLISVNNDNPVFVEVGSYSDYISIQMPGPSLQSLT